MEEICGGVKSLLSLSGEGPCVCLREMSIVFKKEISELDSCPTPSFTPHMEELASPYKHLITL